MGLCDFYNILNGSTVEKTPKKPPVVLKNSRKFMREKLHGKSFLVPSFITVVGIFCGFLAIISAIKGDFLYATRCIIVAIVLDGLDGRVARRLNATSAFGREFDSLSDVMSFGVAPAVLIYCWAFAATADDFGVLVSFLFIACSATRLARFNVKAAEEDSTSGFTGMPTPAAAAAVISIVFCFPETVSQPHYIMGMMVYTVVIGFLMVSNFPFFSIKRLRLSSGNPSINLILLAAAVAFAWKYTGFFLLVASNAYALSGPVGAVIDKSKKSSNSEQAA